MSVLTPHSSRRTKNAPPVRPMRRTGGALCSEVAAPARHARSCPGLLLPTVICRSLSVHHVEDVLLYAVGVRRGFDQLQLLRVLVRGAEQALARAEQQRVDEQVVAVDQAGVGQGMVQRGAAMHDDRAAL